MSYVKPSRKDAKDAKNAKELKTGPFITLIFAAFRALCVFALRR